MARIARNGRQGGDTAWTAVTNASGVATFSLPPSILSVYQGAIPVVSRAIAAVTDRSTAQITSEPAIGTVNTAGLTVAVTVSQSAMTGVLLGGTIPGLGPAPAGITVRLFLHGI